jgi:hypothetical protein
MREGMEAIWGFVMSDNWAALIAWDVIFYAVGIAIWMRLYGRMRAYIAARSVAVVAAVMAVYWTWIAPALLDLFDHLGASRPAPAAVAPAPSVDPGVDPVVLGITVGVGAGLVFTIWWVRRLRAGGEEEEPAVAVDEGSAEDRFAKAMEKRAAAYASFTRRAI